MHSLQGVKKNVGVTSAVESPPYLLQVRLHVLNAHIAEGTGSRLLEEVPDAFNAVGVDISYDPFPWHCG